LDAPLTLRVRSKLLAGAFTCSAQKGTSAGFTRAGVSVWAPASLSVYAGILSFVIALIFTNYALFGMNVKNFLFSCSNRYAIKKTAH
jgi:hypothetical protein